MLQVYGLPGFLAWPGVDQNYVFEAACDPRGVFPGRERLDVGGAS